MLLKILPQSANFWQALEMMQILRRKKPIFWGKCRQKAAAYRVDGSTSVDYNRHYLEHTGERLLKEYFDDILERGVRRRIRGRSASDLRAVIKMVYESCGSELSARKIAGVLGVSVDTISSYLDASEQAYLVCRVPFFAYSEREKAARPKKYYAIDTGLRRSVITRTGRDLGKDFENMVYLQLRRKFKEIYYWKGKGEVDFILVDGNRVTPVQVSWDGIKERHLTALDEFYFHFPQSREALLIDSQNVEMLWKAK